MAAVPSLEQQCEVQTDGVPLLMERPMNGNVDHHLIDIASGGTASPSSSHPGGSEVPIEPPVTLPLTVSPSSNASLSRRGDNPAANRRHISHLNSGLWISVELFVNLSQIVAAIVVLFLSRNEDPQAPLFEWIIGYTVGCFLTLPHLYFRYVLHNTMIAEQGSSNLRRSSSLNTPHRSSSQNNPPEHASYSAISVTPTPGEEGNRNTTTVSRFGPNSFAFNPRLNAFVDHFKMVLDCFFAVWFVVGNVWVFGGHSSAAVAPNLYRLCIVFLTFSCLGYAMPFIMCGVICCCLPCVISVLGVREDMGQNRGATSESINELPTYKFKSKRSLSKESGSNPDSQGGDGILAAGTDKERTISAEDAVCCICLAKYANNDDLRELPCTHFFHVACVDKWLKINALCPLCKSEVGNAAGPSVSGTNTGRRHNDRRVGSGVASEQQAR